MDYKDYQLEDFLTDDFFVKWVKKPDTASDHFWSKWLGNNPEKEVLVTEARKIILKSTYKYMHQPSKEDYLQVLEKIHKREYSERKISQQPNRNILFSIAAVIVLLLVATIIFYPFNFQEEVLTELKETPQKIIKSVPFGKKLQLRLPDGSQVKINSGSTLWYMSDFNKVSRDVHLRGEAFFDVVPNPERPFKVHVGKIITKVLGTSFNVRAYENDNDISISVAKGKVVVYNNEDNNSIPELLPGNMVVYDTELGSFGKEQIEIDHITAWKDNTIILEKASFKEVLKKLEMWYGITFIIDEDMNIEGRFNGKFHDATLKDVLTGLDFSSHINFALKQDTVWCTKKNMPMK